MCVKRQINVYLPEPSFCLFFLSKRRYLVALVLAFASLCCEASDIINIKPTMKSGYLTLTLSLQYMIAFDSKYLPIHTSFNQLQIVQFFTFISTIHQNYCVCGNQFTFLALILFRIINLNFDFINFYPSFYAEQFGVSSTETLSTQMTTAKWYGSSGIVSRVFVEVVAGICERIPEPWCALRRHAGTPGMFGPADYNNTTADSMTAD